MERYFKICKFNAKYSTGIEQRPVGGYQKC